MTFACAHPASGALVTGGSQGLGFAICQRLIAEGCRRIVIASRDADKGAEAVKALSGSGAKAHFLNVEMGDVD